MFLHARAQAHTHAHTCAHTHIFTHTRARSRAHDYVHTPAHTHTHTHAYTHTYNNTHIHTTWRVVPKGGEWVEMAMDASCDQHNEMSAAKQKLLAMYTKRNNTTR